MSRCPGNELICKICATGDEHARSEVKEMFCTSCGSQIPEGSSFCHVCGSPTRTVVESGDDASSRGDPPQPQSDDQSSIADRGPKGAEQISRSKVQPLFMALFGIAAIAVIALGLFALRSLSSSNGPEGSGARSEGEQPSTPSAPIPAASALIVTTLAGSGPTDSDTGGFADGPASSARFNHPTGLAVDRSGNIYLVDEYSNRIRKIASDGTVTTIAGSGPTAAGDTYGLKGGFADGEAQYARFYGPRGVTVDFEGNVYVGDEGNDRIRKITPEGMVTTIAGSGHGLADGPGALAQFRNPIGVDVDSSGNIYVADDHNECIRKISPSGSVSTLAGVCGEDGYADGLAKSARFNSPFDVAVDDSGNVYVAELYGQRIRKISPDGIVSTVAGSGEEGFSNGPAESASFYEPTSLAVDKDGSIYVVDHANNAIRKIAPDGKVTTVAGTGECGFVDGPAESAQFCNPFGITVDTSGNLYVTDSNNHRVRKISPAASSGN